MRQGRVMSGMKRPRPRPCLELETFPFRERPPCIRAAVTVVTARCRLSSVPSHRLLPPDVLSKLDRGRAAASEGLVVELRCLWSALSSESVTTFATQRHYTILSIIASSTTPSNATVLPNYPLGTMCPMRAQYVRALSSTKSVSPRLTSIVPL
jgi:hypothetical protein